ncbi:NlpC/P60 family protein [Azospirillum oleiclasticum]|nr:NlpC/P60 family protein [Azospirillum oleiclasticum]
MFAPSCIAAMKAHALAEFPRECCGVVVGGQYQRLANVAADPMRHFLIPDEVMRCHEGALDAIVHSHPYRESDPEEERIMPWPSRADMQAQLDTAVPWVIVPTDGRSCSDPVVWGDGVPIAPLVGRSFIHGVQDCYSLVRDFHRLELGIALPDFPRDDEWWSKGGNLYLDGFRQAGFVTIDPAQARPGDVFFAQVRSPVPNHAGVLREGSLILHHLQDRLSRHEPIGPWSRMIVRWVRHEKVFHG